MFDMLHVVRARRDVPEQGVTAGMVGTIVLVHETPRRAYEVEFTDADGGTLALATLNGDDLELARAD